MLFSRNIIVGPGRGTTVLSGGCAPRNRKIWLSWVWGINLEEFCTGFKGGIWSAWLYFPVPVCFFGLSPYPSHLLCREACKVLQTSGPKRLFGGASSSQTGLQSSTGSLCHLTWGAVLPLSGCPAASSQHN